jgi:hypothetical protein
MLINPTSAMGGHLCLKPAGLTGEGERRARPLRTVRAATRMHSTHGASPPSLRRKQKQRKQTSQKIQKNLNSRRKQEPEKAYR